MPQIQPSTRPPFEVPPASPRKPDRFAGLLVPLLFVLAHAIFGAVLTVMPSLATIQAAVVAVLVLWASFFSRRLDTAVWMAGYVGTCDVLWRMTEARAPWEFAKYLLILLFVSAFVRHVRVQRRMLAPLVFILLLVPSSALTVATNSLGEAREMMSSYLAGPIALACGVLLFRQLIADRMDVARLFWITLGPIAAVTAIASWETATTPNIEFGDESNFATSGGYGPNQVSTIIGFGALLCLLMALLPGVRRARVIQLVVGGWMLGQAFLTFSRGGIYGLVIAACGMGIVGILGSGARSRALIGGGIAFLVVLGAYAWADGFSSGSLDTRYEDSGGSQDRRTQIAEADLELFSANPVLGVGPGRSLDLRSYDRGNSAHTEYTRLLAEHGIFGFFVMVLMVVFCVQAFRQALGPWNRLLVVGMGLWGLATMTHSATRLAVVSLAFSFMALRVHVPRSLRAPEVQPVFVLRRHGHGADGDAPGDPPSSAEDAASGP